MRLTAEMFTQIVDGLKSDSAGSKDKRREPRVGMAADTDLVTVGPDGKRVAGKARVRDLSANGIGLTFAQPLANGQRFVLQLDSTKAAPIWLVCIAAYSRPGQTAFTVGARVKQVLHADQIAKVEAQTAAATAAAVKVPIPAHAPPTPPLLAVARVSPESDIERISKAILG